MHNNTVAAMNATTVCEMLYKLRDAVAADNLAYALFMSREVHGKLSAMIQSKETKGCTLNCEVKHD